MNKDLKKEYDKTFRNLVIRLSIEEDIVLKKMMSDEEWVNTSGFIKEKVFGNRVNTEYARIIRNAEKKDITTLMQVLMDALVKQLAYLNYRFEYELQDLKNHNDMNGELRKRLIKRMSECRWDVLERTEHIVRDCDKILQRLNIQVKKRELNNLEQLPDSEIERALNGNNTRTPEAYEAVRRSFAKFNEEQQRILNERIKQKDNTNDNKGE